MTWLAEACAHAGSVCNHDALTSVAISLEFSRLSTRSRQRRYPCLEFGQTVHRHVRPSRKLSFKFRFGELNRRA